LPSGGAELFSLNGFNMALSWAVGVTTAPRGCNYLNDTLSSIKAAGWPDVYIFNDSARGGPEHLGPWKNLLRALESLVTHKSDFVALFQDDIEVTEGLRDWLERGNLPVTDGIVSLYCRWEMDSGGRGWQEFDMETIKCNAGHRFPDPVLLGKKHRVCAAPGCKMPLPQPWFQCGGALGYVMRRDVAEALLRCPPRVSGKNQSDYKVAQWCYEQGVPMLYHEPSLVQHMGLCSAAHGNKDRMMPLDYKRVARRFARTTTEIYADCVDVRYQDIKMQPLVYQNQ